MKKIILQVNKNQHIELKEIIVANTDQQIEETENQRIESQETIESDVLSWLEITEDGVNEELFLENLDTEVL